MRTRGVSRAQPGSIIVTLDGDHSYPPDAISYLLEAFLHLEVDFLNASRFPVRDRHAMSFKHKFGNLVLSLAMSMLYFRWVRDSQSGMWVFRRSILDDMRLESDSMAFSEEIKIEALKNPRGAIFRDLDPVFVASGRDQTQSLARRFPQSMVSGKEALLMSDMKSPRSFPTGTARTGSSDLLDDLQSADTKSTERSSLSITAPTTDSPAERGTSGRSRAIRFGANRGFTAAVNRGVAESKTELVAILNNDIRLGPSGCRASDGGARPSAPFATGKLLER